MTKAQIKDQEVTEDPERDPLSPPFAVGTRLRCIEGYDALVPCVDRPQHGGRAKHPEEWVRVSGIGIEVVIDHVVEGRRGTGRQLRDEDGLMFYEDDGAPMLDTTKDGYSVYYVVRGTGHAAKMSGRCIDPDSAHKWEVICRAPSPTHAMCPGCHVERRLAPSGRFRKHRINGLLCKVC